MRRAIWTCLSFTAALCPSSGNASYDSNTTGKISAVLTYDDSHFLIRLDPMPAGPCSEYFIVTGDVDAVAKQMLLARALTANARAETINIGYDGTTCVGGWYRIHRIG